MVCQVDPAVVAQHYQRPQEVLVVLLPRVRVLLVRLPKVEVKDIQVVVVADLLLRELPVLVEIRPLAMAELAQHQVSRVLV